MGYPTSIITFTENTAVGQTVQPQYFNDPYNEIVAIETGLLNGFAHTIKFTPDNTYNIGASGANRPANLYVANSITLAGVGVAPKNISYEQFSGTSTTNSQTVLSSAIGTGPIAPKATTTLKISVTVFCLSTVANEGMVVDLYRSTSGVPSVNTSIPGGDTNLWSASTFVVSTANVYAPLSFVYYDTGLTIGTSYYYYLGYAVDNPGQTMTIGGTPYLIMAEE